MTNDIHIGDRVRVRRHRWTVVDRRAFENSELLTLVGIDATNSGATSTFILPFDIVEPLQRAERVRIVRPGRWRRACRATIAADGGAGSLRTAARARIDLLPHQLEPALAVVAGRSSRLLIADDVGLGKTIQAGLVVSELQARGAGDRVLVLTPAGLREQWAAELAERFGLAPAIVDATELRRRSARLPASVNPWATVPIAIASLDYVKRPEVLPSLGACRWDVVVIDEAHGVTPESDRYDAVAAICARAAYVLLLTATPHSGDRRAFASLCALGAQADGELLVFRRSRSEVALGPSRRVRRLHVSASAAELRMCGMLERFTEAVRSERGDHDRDARLVLTMLHKRAWSSAYSFEQSVRRRLAWIEGQGAPLVAQQWLLPLAEAGEADSSDEPPPWGAAILNDGERERRLLRAMGDAAREASGRETKLLALARLLARLGRLREPAIVFTEYRDTLLHVRDLVAPGAVLLHGGLTRDERRRAVAEFVSGRRATLLATDAAGEGLNLHESCRVVVNLELPWNPMRLEQRIGRVDRIGQRRTVHAVHLIAADTGEIRILARLRHRVEQARAEVGAPDPLGWLLDDDKADGTPLDARMPGARPEAEGSTALASLWTAGRFTAEARTEHTRLRLARQMKTEFHDESADRPSKRDAMNEIGADRWLAFSRHARLRRLCRSSVIALFRTAVDDSCGRIVATHVTPVLIRTARRLTRADVEGIRRVLDAIVPERLDPTVSTWTEASIRLHRAFWSRRAVREQAVAGAMVQGAGVMFQAGLFDRRAVNDHERDARMRLEIVIEAERQAAAAISAAKSEVVHSRPVLVLVV